MPIGRSRKAKDTASCAYCGERFEVLRRPGPYPRYCSAAHKQRAYEQRQRSDQADRRDQLLLEVAALRRRVGRVEGENTDLRRELAEANEELARLRPIDPAIAHLAGRERPVAEPLPSPRRGRRRR